MNGLQGQAHISGKQGQQGKEKACCVPAEKRCKEKGQSDACFFGPVPRQKQGGKMAAVQKAVRKNEEKKQFVQQTGQPDFFHRQQHKKGKHYAHASGKGPMDESWADAGVQKKQGSGQISPPPFHGVYEKCGEKVDRTRRMCYTAKDVRLFADLEPRKEILF